MKWLKQLHIVEWIGLVTVLFVVGAWAARVAAFFLKG
jgi:hypothetical protein